jgi:pyruvate/oxaloacetate carboxyltransferase
MRPSIDKRIEEIQENLSEEEKAKLDELAEKINSDEVELFETESSRPRGRPFNGGSIRACVGQVLSKGAMSRLDVIEQVTAMRESFGYKTSVGLAKSIDTIAGTLGVRKRNGIWTLPT